MDFQQFLKQSAVFLKWVLMGVLMGITISQYDGRIDVHLERTGMSINIDGHPQEQCDIQQF